MLRCKKHHRARSRFGTAMIGQATTFLTVAALSLAACADEIQDTATVMESLEASDWRRPEPQNLLYLRLPSGEVVIELAPRTAPRTVANIRLLVREQFFDGLAVIRSHDNYVAQWGDPALEAADQRSIGDAEEFVTTEFEFASTGIKMVTVDSRDAYADIVGFVHGFPAASDGENTWLAHCYGMLGVARGLRPDSGNGTSLYVVTGHAPRHLDRNLTVAGRVLHGIEHLSALPRGTGSLGFYETAAEQVPIISARMGDSIPSEESFGIEVLRTDTEAFGRYVTSRTHRNEEFFVHPTGRIELCNINPPVRISD